MAKKHHKASNTSHSNRLRIISGTWRSRVIEFEPVPGLRPTGARIRETLFNWLAPVIPGATCLDLFSGSGALGFEAASRGAAEVVMVDTLSAVTRKLSEQRDLLNATNIKIVQSDSLAFLNSPPVTPFDVVFIDPPFNLELLTAVSERLEKNGWLSDRAMIYCEQAVKDVSFSAPKNWQQRRTKVTGDVKYSLYTHIEPTE